MPKRKPSSHKPTKPTITRVAPYSQLVSEISTLLQQARRGAARSVNAILTAKSAAESELRCVVASLRRGVISRRFLHAKNLTQRRDAPT